MNPQARGKRSADLRRRLAEGATERRHCRVFGCQHQASLATGRGLNRLYCRKHEDHHERHGSYFKRSYPAAALAPHLRAALRYLRGNPDEMRVRFAVKAVKGLFYGAGNDVTAFRLRGLSPRDRARVAWARLRDAEVPPERILAVWLAVDAAMRADPQRESRQEFQRVQAAKAIHRLASGSHRRWEREGAGGRVTVTEMHKYPHSRGRVLRHLGEQLEGAADILMPLVQGRT